MRQVVVVLVVLVMSGCVTAPPPKMPTAEAFAPAARAAPLPPEQFSRQFRRASDCEAAAFELIPDLGRNAAWSYAMACAERDDYTELESLIAHWLPELKTRSEVPDLLAHVMASRGAHLNEDLELLHRHRVPIFDLHTALTQTDSFKGRYLVFVGKDAESRGGEVVLLEQQLFSETTGVMAPTHFGSQGYSPWGPYSTESGRIDTRVTEFFEGTGVEIVARLREPDPFLTAEKNLVFLVRFDGARVDHDQGTSDGPEPMHTALVTLISYHGL
jgi:hypothetical protein